MFKPAAAVLVALISVSLSTILMSAATAQQIRIQDFPELPDMPPMPAELGAIMQMHMTNSSNRSITMTMENGVKKINASEDGLKAYIEEDQDGRILVKVTRQYTSENLDELMDLEPELYMHLKSIPEQTDTAEVEVSVGVTREYEADSVDELEKDHPDVFSVYEQFTTGNSTDLQRLHEFPRLMVPELRGMPRGIQLDIQPGDLRIIPLPEQSEESDESDDDDQDT